MAKPGRKTEDFSIVAVTVAARLNDILLDAHSISLEAMNAKVLVSRAGEKARTFIPVTDFMIELARDTTQLVGEINNASISVSRISLRQLRTGRALNRILKKLPQIHEARYGASVDLAVQRISDEIRSYHDDLRNKVHALEALLLEIEQKMRAAQVLSGTTRMEAAAAGSDYQAHFHAVAENLEQSSKAIRDCVIYCRKRIKRAEEKIG